MKKYWKDYVGLAKHNYQFFKKHWFGTLVANAGTTAIALTWMHRDEIIDSIKNLFTKKEEAE